MSYKINKSIANQDKSRRKSYAHLKLVLKHILIASRPRIVNGYQVRMYRPTAGWIKIRNAGDEERDAYGSRLCYTTCWVRVLYVVCVVCLVCVVCGECGEYGECVVRSVCVVWGICGVYGVESLECMGVVMNVGSEGVYDCSDGDNGRLLAAGRHFIDRPGRFCATSSRSAPFTGIKF